MRLTNCWEYTGCGRGPLGPRTAEHGACPAATMAEADGFCGGTNGGRACAYITGTFCGETVQGTHRDKAKHCESCSFYQLLKKEHGADCFVLSFHDYLRRPTGA